MTSSPTSGSVRRSRAARAPKKLSLAGCGPTVLVSRSTEPWTSPRRTASSTRRDAVSFARAYSDTGRGATSSSREVPAGTGPYSWMVPRCTSRTGSGSRGRAASSRSTGRTLECAISSGVLPQPRVALTTVSTPSSARIAASPAPVQRARSSGRNGWGRRCGASRRAIATTSVPRAAKAAHRCRPTQPVAPRTATRRGMSVVVIEASVRPVRSPRSGAAAPGPWPAPGRGRHGPGRRARSRCRPATAGRAPCPRGRGPAPVRPGSRWTPDTT